MRYVGLDWADTHHDVEVQNEAGKRVGARRFAHSHDGLHELKAFLLGIATSPEELACIVETNHGLLITFLLEAGIPVYPVNPKSANQLRKAAGAKTDRIDAHLLAKLGRFDLAELRRLEPDSSTVAELKALTRDQDALIQTQTRLVNQLTACLKEYYPVALHLFAKVQQRSTLVFLQAYPTPQDALAASLEEITATMRAGKHTNPRRVAPKIVAELHRPQLLASEVIVRAKSRLMLSLFKQLLVVIQEIASYDKAIRTLFSMHNDQELWRLLPGEGLRLAPRLLAEWGDDRSRYADATSVQTLAGTAPVPFESGNYAKAHKRFACLKPLHNALHQFAWQSTQQEAWARDYYQRKRAQGKTHSMALRALANVWVRIIYRMWVNKTSYQTAIFEAAQRTSCTPATHRLSRRCIVPSRPPGHAQRCEVLRECRKLVLQQSRPSGSRRVLSADRELLLLQVLSLQRLPQPATAFPTPGVGCWHKTTPSQGRAQASERMDGGGRPVHACLGLDSVWSTCTTTREAASPTLTLLLPFRALALDIEGLFSANPHLKRTICTGSISS